MTLIVDKHRSETFACDFNRNNDGIVLRILRVKAKRGEHHILIGRENCKKALVQIAVDEFAHAILYQTLDRPDFTFGLFCYSEHFSLMRKNKNVTVHNFTHNGADVIENYFSRAVVVQKPFDLSSLVQKLYIVHILAHFVVPSFLSVI